MPGIEADERRITQHVLVNLLKNAIKFTPAGEIEVGARFERDQVLFWVADTGIGIASSWPSQRPGFSAARGTRDDGTTRNYLKNALGGTPNCRRNIVANALGLP